jgi:hypothetical protein
MDEKKDAMVIDEFDKSYKRTMDLLDFLLRKMKDDPDNKDYVKIFDGIVSVAQSQLRTDAVVSDVYFSKYSKNYSLAKVEKREFDLRRLSRDVKESKTK